MHLPKLYENAQTRETVDCFGGYNRRARIGDGEFYDMKNLSSDGYPTLSPRGRRGEAAVIEKCNGMLARDKLAYIDGNLLRVGDFAMILDASVKGERQLVAMGAYLLVFPDAMYVNTVDTSDCGSIYGEQRSYGGNISLSLCDGEGNAVNIRDLLLDTGNGNSIRSTVSKNGCFVAKPSQYNDKSTYIVINSIDLTQRKQYLYGIPHGTLETSDGTSVSYSVNHVIGNWGIVNGYAIYELGEDAQGYYFRTRWETLYGDSSYEAMEGHKNELEKYFRSYPAGIPVFGRLELTRTVDGDSMKRTYNITVSSDYSVSWNPLNVGDIRLCERENGGAKLQRCTSFRDDPVTTWNEASCWQDIESFLKLKVEGTAVGTDLQAIIDSDGSESIRLSYYGGTHKYFLASLLKQYSASAVELVKKSIKYYSSDTFMLRGCMNFVCTASTESGELAVFVNPSHKPLDFVIESGNRLWGCRYGKNERGEFVNEIYATAHGSFRNWDVYNGTAGDSYAVSVGSEGKFTGAVNFRGYPLFFKEGCYHMVHGYYPASYQLVTDTGTGVQAGSHKSLCIMRNVLYYKAPDGVYCFDGSAYAKISEALGGTEYTDASGGGVDGKYYISMAKKGGERELFVYDTEKGLWYREDGGGIKYFARLGGELYMYDADTHKLLTAKGTVGAPEDAVEWFAETGEIGYASADARYLDKLQLRISLPHGSKAALYIEYDGDGYFEHIGSVEGSAVQAFTLPVMPRRCDRFRLRISGVGECKLISISKITEEGGEV